MQTHELQVKGKQTRKRVGRGGKRGTFSGAGMKGQKARSGAPIKALFEGGRSSLVMRMKKLRGFKSPHAKRLVISLDQLNAVFADGESVTRATLMEKGLIRKRDKFRELRITGGTIEKKLEIASDISLSTPAKALLEKAGGTVLVKETATEA